MGDKDGNNTDYMYLRLWCTQLGSSGAYTQSQIHLARKEGAPQNAIYRIGEGVWKTTDDIISRSTRLRMGLEPIVAVPARLEVIMNDGTRVGWEVKNLDAGALGKIMIITGAPEYKYDY